MRRPHSHRAVVVATMLFVLAGCTEAADLVPTDPATPTAAPTTTPQTEPTKPAEPVTVALAPIRSQAPAKPGDCGDNRAAPPDQDPRPVVCGRQDGKQVAYTLDTKHAAEVTIESATATFVETYGTWVVNVNLAASDAKTLERLTRRASARGARLAVVYQGEVVVAPEVTQPLATGQLQVSGSYTEQEAQALADRLSGL